MGYEVTNKQTNEKEVLSEQKAEAKYGSVDFTMMVAGVSNTHTAINLSVESDESEFDPYSEDDVDISEAFA